MFSHTPASTYEVVQATSQIKTPRWAKLSPNVTNLVEIANAAKEAGADGVTLINTVMGMVIDIDKRSIRNGMKDAERKGIGNVKYGVGDASDSNNIEILLNSKKEQFDIIVALHACGALTDVALGHAVTNAAGFVITPCCFRSNDFLPEHHSYNFY